MFRQIHYEFLLRAMSPIAHHSESIGNMAIAMRRKFRQADGSFADVPIVTADTMRHGLREASAYAMLDAVGALDSQSLTESALRLLFAGGTLPGGGDGGTVKLTDYRTTCEMCPPLRLLGGCCSRIMPGKMEVSDLVLISQETRDFWPEWVAEWVLVQATAVDTCRVHVEEVQRVRMDPALNPGKVALLTDGEQARIEARLLKSEKATETNDAIAKDDAKSTMLPRSFETIVTGSLFTWSIVATCQSDLDIDTLHTMLGAFLANATVGGKRGTGHGKLQAIAARDISVARPKDASSFLDLANPELHVSRLFRAHLAERKEKIIGWLKQVVA